MSEPVYYEGVWWEPAHVQPGDSAAPRFRPMCPFCKHANVSSEARPMWDDLGDRPGIARNPVRLQCAHPCHAADPFEVAIEDARYDYATMRLGS